VVIEGIVSEGGNKGVSGTTVVLLTTHTANAPREPVAHTVSGDKGRFRMVAPPGVYLLTAHDKEERFAFFGRNPVRAHADQKGLNLPLVPIHPVEITQVESGNERISGHILFEGKPATGARGYLYLNADKGFRGPPYLLGAVVGEDGYFEAMVEPGSYYLTAKRRESGSDRGPLSTDDLFGVHGQMALQLRTGNAITTDIELVALPSIGRRARYLADCTRLEGIIVDHSGTPMPGFRACLYDNPRMLDEPLEVSPPTGEDGKFLLTTTRLGAHHLGAREKLGGPPQTGEQVGFLRESPAAGLDLTPGGKLDGLVIVVQPVP
jgi:hypothetical protein